MQEILDLMRNRLSDEHYERFAYLFSSGKRIRPNLMKNICAQIDKDFDPLIAAAAAVEVMHCVSLVHDDVIDRATARRDSAPFYKKYGTNSAVLFGDLFATMSIEILAEEYPREIYLEFIRTFKNMIEGQIMELEGKVVDRNSYFDYTEKKTASLFVLCAKIPLLYHGMSNDSIVEFAREFGFLFQMANDIEGEAEIGILDFISKEDTAALARRRIDHLRSMKLEHLDKSLDVLGRMF